MDGVPAGNRYANSRVGATVNLPVGSRHAVKLAWSTGAIIRSGADFTTVQFWGDGYGEVLNFGGTIHYALLNQGSLPPTGVPEPGEWLLLCSAAALLMGYAYVKRRQPQLG